LARSPRRSLTISEIPFNGPIGSIRVGRIGGEFVINPTHSQLAESELDLIVAGTRDAIMMVEAGAKLLPEAVMAEAILFGHRALQPIVALQEEIQKAVGKQKRIPYLEPSTNSVLEFASATDAKRELVVIDVETTGTDPKMADLLEVAAVKIKGTKIVDRWSTFVNPGRPIVGNQMHGITDKDVKGAPSPKEAAEKLLAFIGDALVVGHNVGFDIGFIEEAMGDGFRVRPGSYIDTLIIARDGYPGAESYKLGDLARFFGIELARAIAPCPTPKRPPICCCGSPTTCRAASRPSANRSRTPCGPTAPGATRLSSSRPPGARRGSARACSTCSRRRPFAGSSSTRGSGSTAAA
jgi:DNA polymerase III epsilon subunit-like protein